MKKKLSLFGKIKDRAKRVKGLFREKKKDGADHCGLGSENEAPSRDVELMVFRSIRNQLQRQGKQGGSSCHGRGK